MSCDNYLALISARLDGELTEQEQADLARHLRSCAACRAAAEDMTSLHSVLTDLGQTPAPAQLTPGVLTRIKEEKHRSRRRLVRQLSALAACFVLLVGIARIADAVYSDSARQRQLPQPAPLSLTGAEPGHCAFANDRYLPVTWGSTPAAPSARIIGSSKSLSDFLAAFPADDLSSLTKEYPEDFFRSGRLLAVVLEEPTGANRHRLLPQGLLSDSVTVCRHTPEAGDCVMTAWLILAEVDSSFSDGDLLAVTFSN